MSRPLAARRQNEIVARLRSADAVSVGEMAAAFGVSHETIRRDLKALAAEGQLDLVHGGAVRRGGRTIEPEPDENNAARAAIARTAAALVDDGATVLLDGGPITAAIAHELFGRSGLIVCTNSPGHALILCRNNQVFLLGGEIDATRTATFGADAITALDKFRVDIAFVGADGFAEDGAATDISREAAELHARMMLSGRSYVVADQSRFSRRTPFRIANFDKIAGIIIDSAPDTALAEAWTNRGLNVMVSQ